MVQGSYSETEYFQKPVLYCLLTNLPSDRNSYKANRRHGLKLLETLLYQERPIEKCLDRQRSLKIFVTKA